MPLIIVSGQHQRGCWEGAVGARAHVCSVHGARTSMRHCYAMRRGYVGVLAHVRAFVRMCVSYANCARNASIGQARSKNHKSLVPCRVRQALKHRCPGCCGALLSLGVGVAFPAARSCAWRATPIIVESITEDFNVPTDLEWRWGWELPLVPTSTLVGAQVL